jgi:SAM-dependent methyltransferase
MESGDAAFVGAIPAIYERLLVPMIFAEPARHLAAAVLATDPDDILETAAGTGALTRELVRQGDASVTATDLNEPMLRSATELCGSSRMRWLVADALDLPLPDGTFDVVACQFGVMFFPDKPRGYAEALRVLRPSGTFLFNAWDRLEANPAWRVVNDALNEVAEVPIEFLRRVPYSYSDPDVIRLHLQTAGFDMITIDYIEGTSRSTADEMAMAVCQGTPLSMELARHPDLGIERATAVAADALRRQYGEGSITAPISWLQVSARSSRSGADDELMPSTDPS